MAEPLPDQARIRRQSWATFIVATSLLLVPTLDGFVNFDEGAIATGSLAVLRGELPYRDFFSPYGPAQYYAAAALFAVFSEDLLVLHVAHAVALGALVVVVSRLTHYLCVPQSRAPLVVAALATAALVISDLTPGYPAVPATLLLLLAAIGLARDDGDTERFPRLRVALTSSLLIGASGLFRWDFGAFGLAALSIAWVVVEAGKRAPWQAVLGRALAISLPGIALMTLVYVPLLHAAPLQRWLDEVFWYVLFDLPKWRGIEFARPMYWMLVTSVEAMDGPTFLLGIFRLLSTALPPVVAIIVLASAGRRAFAGPAASGRDLAILYTGLLAILLVNQLRVRPHFWQAFPAFVVSLPLLGVVGNSIMPHLARRSPWRFVAWPLLALAASAFLVPALWALLQAVGDERAPMGISRASGVLTDTYTRADYANLVHHVATHTAPGEPIYSGVHDHTRLLDNDVMLYFLADRPPATRYAELAPGMANTASGQQQIIHELDSKRVNLIVLLRKRSRERNLSSQGVVPDLLDRYLQDTYVATRRFGRYIVMERRAGH